MGAPTTHTATMQVPTKLVFGAGAVDDLGKIAQELGAARALVVTDAGVAGAGHAQRAADALAGAGLEAAVYDAVNENPTTEDVGACVDAAKAARADLLVGVGGGSSIDTARGCNFLLTNGGRMQDYWGVGKAAKPMLPMVAVPTTTGTGSETQSFALIADAKSNRKMACGDKKAAARAAVLDPTLAATQPRGVIAATGLDAISHAIESAVCVKRTPFSLLFSHEAWRLASARFRRILSAPGDLDAQGEMLLASAYAGLAIEHSMLGAAHSMANPLTTRFGVTHGLAVGLCLPHVMRFNAKDEAARAQYARMARAADSSLAGANDSDAASALTGQVQRLLEACGAPRRLGELDVAAESIDALAADAAQQWTAQFNPRPVSIDEFRVIYQAAM